jgi:hypothetical protein
MVEMGNAKWLMKEVTPANIALEGLCLFHFFKSIFFLISFLFWLVIVLYDVAFFKMALLQSVLCDWNFWGNFRENMWICVLFF